jgi:hypothetical protein
MTVIVTVVLLTLVSLVDATAIRNKQRSYFCLGTSGKYEEVFKTVIYIDKVFFFGYAGSRPRPRTQRV